MDDLGTPIFGNLYIYVYIDIYIYMYVIYIYLLIFKSLYIYIIIYHANRMTPVPGALLTLDRVVAMILLEKLRLDI